MQKYFTKRNGYMIALIILVSVIFLAVKSAYISHKMLNTDISLVENKQIVKTTRLRNLIEEDSLKRSHGKWIFNIRQDVVNDINSPREDNVVHYKINKYLKVTPVYPTSKYIKIDSELYSDELEKAVNSKVHKVDLAKCYDELTFDEAERIGLQAQADAQTWEELKAKGKEWEYEIYIKSREALEKGRQLGKTAWTKIKGLAN